MDKFQGKYRISSARLVGYDYGQEGVYFITICTQDRAHFFGEIKNGKMILNGVGAMVQGFWYDIPHHFDHVSLGEFVVMPNHVHGILILDMPKTNNDGRDSYNDGRDSFNDGRDSFNDGRDSFNDGRDSFNDGRDSYNDGHDSFNDGRIVETLQCNVSTANSGNSNNSDNSNNSPNSNNSNNSNAPFDSDNSDTTPNARFFQTISPKPGSVPTIIRSYKSVCTKYINQHQPDLHFAWQTRYHDHIIRNHIAFERISNYIRNNPQKWAEDRFHPFPIQFET